MIKDSLDKYLDVEFWTREDKLELRLFELSLMDEVSK